MKIKKISFIIPVYNEQTRILASLNELNAYFKTFKFEYEIIFVNDGSDDSTKDILTQYINENNLKYFKALDFTFNRGKGAAIKFGMLNASQDSTHFFFMDIDLSTPLSEIDNFIKHLTSGNEDIIIGSRSLQDSRVLKRQIFYRECMGKTFNKIVKLIIFTKFIDTQCGFKLFNKRAKEKIFRNLRIARFSFDVEIIFLAAKYGFSISEKPVIWINNELSKVNIIYDSLQMFIDIFKIRWYWFTNKYEK